MLHTQVFPVHGLNVTFDIKNFWKTYLHESLLLQVIVKCHESSFLCLTKKGRHTWFFLKVVSYIYVTKWYTYMCRVCYPSSNLFQVGRWTMFYLAWHFLLSWITFRLQTEINIACLKSGKEIRDETDSILLDIDFCKM